MKFENHCLKSIPIVYRLIMACRRTPNWNFTGLVISDISTRRRGMDCFHPTVTTKVIRNVPEFATKD